MPRITIFETRSVTLPQEREKDLVVGTVKTPDLRACSQPLRWLADSRCSRTGEYPRQKRTRVGVRYRRLSRSWLDASEPSATDTDPRATLPTPSEMIDHLDRFVLGQARAKKDLATAIYNHYLGCRYSETPAARFSDFERQHVLMLGPTGSGKTLIARTLADLLKVPISVASASSFAEPAMWASMWRA